MSFRREIASIVWQEDGGHLYIVYTDGAPDKMIGTRAVAAQFAAEVGLTLDDDGHGSMRWTRAPAS